MKRLGRQHTNILPPTQSNAISSPKEPFYKMRYVWNCTLPPGEVVKSRWRDYTQVLFFFSFSPCEGLLFACLGCERRTLAASKILPEKRGSKTNRAVCIQVGAEPQNHSLACGSQHSVPALTSPKTNTLNTRPPQPEAERNLRKSLDSNSINKCSPPPPPSLSHSYFSDRCFHRALGKRRSFHALVTRVGLVSFEPSE